MAEHGNQYVTHRGWEKLQLLPSFLLDSCNAQLGGIVLKRKTYDFLIDWKQSHKKACLLANGSRQVGKSLIIERFGMSAYSSFIKIDFIEHPDCKDVFAGPLSAKDIYSRITLNIAGARIIDGDTLILRLPMAA